jgi:hypothetical protein
MDLRPSSDSILLIRVGDQVDGPSLQAFLEMLGKLRPLGKAWSNTHIPVLIVPEGVSLEQIATDVMLQAGWQRIKPPLGKERP